MPLAMFRSSLAGWLALGARLAHLHLAGAHPQRRGEQGAGGEERWLRSLQLAHHQHFCDHRSSWVLRLPRWRSLQHLGGASDTAVAQGLPLFSYVFSHLQIFTVSRPVLSSLSMSHVLNKHEICRLLLKYGKRTIDSFSGLCLQCDQLCQLACWERGVKGGRGRAVCLQVCTRDGHNDDDLRMLIMVVAKEKVWRCLPNQGDMVAD